MGKLPRADELPRTEDGYDAARVEEAFASFADRVRELESVAGELRAELLSLRSERASAGLTSAGLTSAGPAGAARAAWPFEDEEWPVEPGRAASGPTPDWISSVPAPVVRPLTIPRIALEGAFLVLVALFAGLADLSATWIALVMAVAWALVAVSEWAAAAKRTRWRLDEVADPLELSGEPAGEKTGPWNLPVVEATAIDLPEVSESHTVVVAQLPPDPGEEDPAGENPAEEPSVDQTGDLDEGETGEGEGLAAAHGPRRRLRLPRRRKPEPATDPREA